MVRRGALKLYRYGDETPVLHDLASDPSERRDLWGDARYAKAGVAGHALMLVCLALSWSMPCECGGEARRDPCR